MDLKQFGEQLDRCGQSQIEIRRFVQDFALVRLTYIVRALRELESGQIPVVPPSSEAGISWTDMPLVRESGVESEWITGLDDPGKMYLHAATANTGDWREVAGYLDRAFLSGKQRRLLFPELSRARRRRRLALGTLSEEVRRLNSMLRWAAESGMTPETFGRYQAHLGVHGASQNVGGQVGAAGAALAIMEALNEISPGRIANISGQPFPTGIRTPIEIYNYLHGPSGQGVRAILLDNGRAIVFSADPDVAIFQSLGARYATADEALRAWEEVRREIGARANLVHQFAVGEVKTATDVQSLHERLALGSRETREEVKTDRFLMMAVLTPDILSGGGGRRRRSTGLANHDVERFSDVFNLYFAWGYDDARDNHGGHWSEFKRRVAEWCGL